MGTALEEKLLTIVSDFFATSHDFNGIPSEKLAKRAGSTWEEIRPAVSALIRDRRIDAVFNTHQENPHVRRFPALPSDEQINRLATNDFFCLYPTTEVMARSAKGREFDDRLFTKRLFLGEPQLVPVFFELDALEQYFRDPRYAFSFLDFSGRISLHSEQVQSGDMEERDKTFLQSFGIAYDQNSTRVVVVYLRYLSDLSPEHQQIWKAKEIKRPCTMNSDYARATLYGHWAEHHSVYQAFIHEQVELNKLAALMGKQRLFLKTFEDDRPSGFHPMLPSHATQL
jgi:hypothetical protein